MPLSLRIWCDMAIVVEDGSGLANSESYVSVDDCVAYATLRGLSFESQSGLQEAALRRATSYIDSTYGTLFNGTRAKIRAQKLAWPRNGAKDREGNPIAVNEIPIELRNATCEAALKELMAPNSLLPDLERGGKVKRLKAGSVEIEYSNGAPSETVLMSIRSALSNLVGLRPVNGSSSVKLVRA
jgi:hypothetical protein